MFSSVNYRESYQCKGVYFCFSTWKAGTTMESFHFFEILVPVADGKLFQPP